MSWIAASTEAGDVIKGTSELRKVRWARAGMGKRGGARVIHFNRNEQGDLVLLVYVKAKFDNIPAATLVKLKEALDAKDKEMVQFEKDLLQSVGEMKRGEHVAVHRLWQSLPSRIRASSMATMNISLPDEMKAFVDAQVADCRYGNASEYMRDLIRQDLAREQFRAAIFAGLESGPAVDWPPAHFDELRAEISQVEAVGTRASKVSAGRKGRPAPVKAMRKKAT
ncbi:putative addiction module CopG family antidote [Variovorax boronicumulans]|uniref:Addiction module CopG family antidote n=1 Tax=Variovorax boronicumulans TaxID=436515 RepID=A0AAW8D7X0_9BURK|nr:type II toxin-antitoxin system ParD family antitoxin [Variovorax boronicumulans]MDP9896329.1 putative addiction module CopG family antidote [Variovorax boronicumulans]MDQ0056361.1 putative addiction module CopG family antidote [Variovorax boronicumulans]